MTEDSEKWLNLFLAVEDIEKIKKSFNNLTTEMLHQKIINLQKELKKKVDKNKNQALEITKLLEQKKDLQEINDSQNEYIRQLKSDITFKVEESKQLQKENSFVKSEHNKIIEKLNESRKETTISDDIRYNLEKKLKEKDTIISYLESKLK